MIRDLSDLGARLRGLVTELGALAGEVEFLAVPDSHAAFSLLRAIDLLTRVRCFLLAADVNLFLGQVLLAGEEQVAASDEARHLSGVALASSRAALDEVHGILLEGRRRAISLRQIEAERAAALNMPAGYRATMWMRVARCELELAALLPADGKERAVARRSVVAALESTHHAIDDALAEALAIAQGAPA